jgi:hypothetical protein
LPALRIVLTLAIEGLIFFIFGYRSKSSWAVFLSANLLTLLFINVTLYKNSDPWNSYYIMSLIFGEFVVFVFETIVFLLMIKEHEKMRTLAYVMVANLASLFLGGYLITMLSV